MFYGSFTRCWVQCSRLLLKPARCFTPGTAIRYIRRFALKSFQLAGSAPLVCILNGLRVGMVRRPLCRPDVGRHSPPPCAPRHQSVELGSHRL